MRTVLILLFLALCGPLAAQTYEMPDPVLAKLVDQPRLPAARVSPDRDWVCFFRRPGLERIEDLSGAELKLAGIRFNPERYTRSRTRATYDQITMRQMDSAKEWTVKVPEGKIHSPMWSPDSRHLLFGLETSDGMRLWIVEAGGKEARLLSSRRVNTVLDSSIADWSVDSKSVIALLVLERKPFEQDATPKGPVIQETTGSKAPVRTYQDLLKDDQDAEQFEFYATSQPVRIGLEGSVSELGPPSVAYALSSSPDGKYFLQEVLDKPYSFAVPAYRFGGRYLILSDDGKELLELAKFEASENLPKGFDSVRTGLRNPRWRADVPASLVWAEAADGGDMKADVAVHDRVFQWSAPFKGEASKLLDMEMRYGGISWGHKNFAMVNEWRFSDRKTRTWVFDPAAPEAERVLFEDRSYNDRYKDPGTPLRVPLDNGYRVLATGSGDELILAGYGASPEGKIPFLDRWDRKTGKTRRVWRSEAPYYERVIGMLDRDGKQLITLRESVDEPANFFARDLSTGKIEALTSVPHPAPEFKGIKKEIIKYKRADGVDLSGTLYLPADYEGGKLPVIMWAYPLEYKDPSVAGQVTTSPYTFKRVSYWGPLPFLAQGYAVFDDPKMPIIGEGDKLPNDSFRSQLVASAEAAVNVLVEKGVCDPDRVAIGGHSYGAFMVANLLAHSELFKTGIARSGAYNRSLTPFGFQGEERDFWEAQSVYARMSPFFHAEKINEPMLMIHGSEDNNSGTYPMQSERMFAAMKGLGGKARLVMLPKESHGYKARESILHMLWEEQEWLKTYLR